jgi:hypothetical protein
MYPRLMNRDLDLVAKLASIRDDELVGEANLPDAALLESIVALPVPRADHDPAWQKGRWRLVAVFTGLAIAAALSVPALGVGDDISSFFGRGHDPEQPVQMRSDVLVASGTDGVSWKILATTSDRGLCLDLSYRFGDDWFGPGHCGYTGIRGDLPASIRGNPAETCVGPATELEPGGTLRSCGSLPLHWIELGDSLSSAGLEARLSFGPLATDVSSVELILTNGKELDAHVVKEPGGLPLNVYWASWACPLNAVGSGKECREGGPELEMAIARDLHGRVLERRVPPWNGNPTGDPVGPARPD